MRSNQRRWTGRSAVARLSPGRSFALKHHPYADWNQEYLVISVHHEVRVPMPGVELTEDWAGYRNSFEVIQQSTTFRPARVTPTPRMDGLLNARIDGAGQRDKAELDDQGRYRVRVPFDNSDTPDGKGSQWVRMASPFGGDGDGMHFPLAPDTEVVVACVNGDPNRPIILGAVPNPRNKSVVTRENSLRNRMVTRTGMGFEMGADGGGAAGNSMGGGAAANNRVATQSAYGATPALGAPNAFGTDENQGASAPDNAQTFDQPAALMAVSDAATANNYARLYSTLEGSYLRLGAVPPGSGAGEPTTLTNPGALGVNAASASSNKKENPTFGAPTARTDSLLNNQPGTYLQTGGGMFIANNGNAALKSGGEIILSSVKDITLYSTGTTPPPADPNAVTGSIRLYANGNADLYVGKTLNILSNGDINFESKGNININSEKTMNLHSGGTFNQDSDENTIRETSGNTRSWNWGGVFTGVGGGNLSVTMGSTFTLAVGNWTDIALVTKIDIRMAFLFEFEFGNVYTIGTGFKLEVNAAELELKDMKFDINRQNTEISTLNTSVGNIRAELAQVDTKITSAVDVQAQALAAHKTNIKAALGELTIGQKKAKIDSVAAVALII